MLLHQIILFEDSLWKRFKFGHFGLNLISLMPELFVLLFEMINERHKILNVQIEADAVGVWIWRLVVGWNLGNLFME